MNVVITLYQRKSPAGLEWLTLGLGPFNEQVAGRQTTKMERELTKRLRKSITTMPPVEFARFQLQRSQKLERVRLDLVLRPAGKRWRATGVFPLIVANFVANEDEKLVIAYHPERQEEWFPVRPDEPLEAQAIAYFEDTWEELSEEAIQSLQSNGKDSLKLLTFSAKPKEALDGLKKERGPWDDLDTRKKPGKYWVLPALGTNLTSQAIDGTLSTGMPRSPYREQLQLLLGSERTTSILVVGPSGSGKSTLIRQWVADALAADGYQLHRNVDRVREAWLVSGKRIIAGMSYQGEWQKRCLDLLEDARGTALQRRILVVDDIHAWGRIGRSRESDSNLAMFFRSAVARGEICLVGECTPEQLQLLEDDASGFAALFTQLRVQPADRTETLRMAIRESRELEERHRIEWEPSVFPAVYDQSGSLFSGSSMPGTALDLLRDLARHTAGGDELSTVGPSQVIKALSKRTGLPEALLKPREKLDPAEVERAFSRQVAGQPEAVEAAVDLIARIRAGLTDPGRPYAVYLLTGPTGTGKTELARSITSYLYGDESRLLRIDCSEYAASDAGTRLVGDVFQPDGVLTSAVRAQPFCVVLFDEVEKAHPRVLNLLLQVFDDGRLTDAGGYTADFTHAVILMTSNLGAMARAPIGLGEVSAEAVRQDEDRAIREFFAPELFNRIDRIVHFLPLTRDVAVSIVEKELAKLLSRRGLTGRNIFVTVDTGVKELVVRDAFDAKYGARPLKRYLEDHVGAKLADHLSARTSSGLQLLRIFEKGGALALEGHTLTPADPSDAEWAIRGALDENLDELRERLPGLKERLDALGRNELLDEISQRIGYHLSEHNRGRAGHAEQVLALDLFRSALSHAEERLRALLPPEPEEEHEWLETAEFGEIEYQQKTWRGDKNLGPERYRLYSRQAVQRQQVIATRDEVLSLLADVAFLERSSERLGDPSRNSVTVVLAPVGQMRRGDRFGTGGSQLVSWLSTAYSTWRGRVESIAWRSGKGALVESLVEPDGVTHAVLNLSGLCVSDLFEGEHGCHVWESLGRLPEVIQVTVLPGEARSAREVLLDAVERSTSVLEPSPVVRTYQFEPPLRLNETAPLKIEDYSLDYVAEERVHALAEGLVTPWLLRLSRRG